MDYKFFIHMITKNINKKYWNTKTSRNYFCFLTMIGTQVCLKGKDINFTLQLKYYILGIINNFSTYVSYGLYTKKI